LKGPKDKKRISNIFVELFKPLLLQMCIRINLDAFRPTKYNNINLDA